MKLSDIKGVGPKINQILISKGITDINSLLYTFPTSYTEYKLTGFSYFGEFNAKATIIDEIKETKLKNVTKISFDAMVDGLRFSCTCFNMSYIKNAFKIGSEVVIAGEYQKEYKSIIINKIFKLTDYKEGIVPEYNIDGISNPQFKKIVLEAINYYEPRKDIIPKSYYEKYGYVRGKSLLLAIHDPKSMNEVELSKGALKYHELLSFSIKMGIIRKNQDGLRKIPKKYDISKVKDFIELGVHFEFTEDQKRAINNIFKFLGSEIPLNMLLEGDVGCGKTIVAIVASYAVYTASYQTLVMVPTEALAFQHFNSFKEYLEPFGLNIGLLTSSVSAKGRREILEKLKNGNIDIIIGTHSLLNDEVEFKNLGFIVCDEQHKFGVEQRKKMKAKADNPDVLYMTATPIPRTLALTIFNDMTLEAIKTLPKSKKKIYTHIHTYKDYLNVLDFVRSEVEDSRQAYFVAPAIDDNPETSLLSVLRVKNDLEKYLPGLSIGLLHGKLTSDEKESIIDAFMKNEIDILVSTTVIEVGINNPNASCMVILDANQFGLSNLHQLRGRVGRGKDEGYCFLMVENKDYVDKLKILEETQDGFIISEEDLRQRGPGDFLGVNQSGMLKFNFADYIKDSDILGCAMKDAKELIEDTNIYKYYSDRLYSDNFD